MITLFSIRFCVFPETRVGGTGLGSGVVSGDVSRDRVWRLLSRERRVGI